MGSLGGAVGKRGRTGQSRLCIIHQVGLVCKREASLENGGGGGGLALAATRNLGQLAAFQPASCHLGATFLTSEIIQPAI